MVNLLLSATLILLFSGTNAVSGSKVRGDVVSGKENQKEQVTHHLLDG